MDNDYELLYLATEDLETAAQILLKKYDSLLLFKSLKYSASSLTIDDFVNEAKQSLYEAIENYKDDCTFFTYLSVCLDRNLYNYRKSLYRKKHLILNDALSLDDKQIENMLSINDERYNPEKILMEEQNYQELRKNILDKLTWKEELIFTLKEQNYTNKEISEITDNNLRTVYNIIRRIQSKVSKLMSN